MIVIIDYDAGNIRSVEKALQALGEQPVLSADADTIMAADKVILPGVGSFGEAMERLNQYGLVEVIHRVAEQNTPFLGICLGMQLLFEGSAESPGVAGLKLLEGEILRIPDCAGLKIPHMGWNSLQIRPGTKLFREVLEDSYVYFVHSYYLRARDEAIVAASAEYGTHIHAAVEKNNIFGCQFHPEKSSGVGLKILKNFIELELV